MLLGKARLEKKDYFNAAIEFKNYQKAIIVSGDGDFFCLHQYLIKKKKLLKIIIPNKHSESSLLKNLQQYKLFLYREKEKLEYVKNSKIRPKKIGRRHS